jgi:hypothetical protein
MAIYKQLFTVLGFHGTSTTFVILKQDTYDGESFVLCLAMSNQDNKYSSRFEGFMD